MTQLTEIAVCVACNGSGQRSAGGPCPPCKGTGRNPEGMSPNMAPYRAAFGDHAGQLQQAQTALGALQTLAINTEADYVQAGQWLTTCKSIIKQNEDKRKAITQPLMQAKREVDSWFKPIVNLYQQAESVLKQKLLEFQARQLAERQRIAQQMAVEHAAQNTANMMQLASQAQQTQTPQVDGVQMRSVTKWRVIDANAIPREYLMIDETKVRLAMSNGQPIPGIEFYKEATIAASAR